MSVTLTGTLYGKINQDYSVTADTVIDAMAAVDTVRIAHDVECARLEKEAAINYRRQTQQAAAKREAGPRLKRVEFMLKEHDALFITASAELHSEATRLKALVDPESVYDEELDEIPF